MKINELNGRIIDTKEVYIHDDILHELIFCRLRKRMKLIIEKYEMQNKKYEIKFTNVIGFEMTSCDFWGRCAHILDFEYVEQDDRVIIPKLFKRKKLEFESSCDFLTEQGNYIETLITFSSGDQLRIACEEIVIEDNS